jgi:hypothetical protein
MINYIMSRYDNMMVVRENMDKIMVSGVVAGAITAASHFWYAGL